MITIVPYRASWRGEFLAIGSNVRDALGSDALRIDHIGSTAVPGLAAKDVIDVQVTVAKLDPRIEEGLVRMGYRRSQKISCDHVPPGWEGNEADWVKWFFNGPAEQRATNLHLRIRGRANQRYPLLFRDYLRSHEPAAVAYAQVKLALARLHPEDADAYYDVKDPVCDIIMTGAAAWAERIGWEMGDSDC